MRAKSDKLNRAEIFWKHQEHLMNKTYHNMHPIAGNRFEKDNLELELFSSWKTMRFLYLRQNNSTYLKFWNIWAIQNLKS